MDVVTFGETMVLFVPTTEGPIRYADRFKKTIGGAETNVAIALARLGHEVGWISRLGDDEFGRYVLHAVRGEGVDTTQVVLDSTFPTGVFFKERRTGQDPNIYYYRRDSAASRLSPEDLDLSYLKRARMLHLTGVTPALSESARQTMEFAVKWARKENKTILLDPNLRLKLWGIDEARKVLMRIAQHCDVVMPGLEEGQQLTGEATPEAIASLFLENGSKLAVIKLGERGAYYATREESGYIEAVPVRSIVDTAGAGDGFAAGFISGLLRGRTYPESIALGNRVGAYALTVAGDVEGYPFWSQLEAGESIILR